MLSGCTAAVCSAAQTAYARVKCIAHAKQPQSFLSCHRTDLGFITKMVDKEAMDRLRKVASTPFERCTYTRAIELLEEAVKGGKKFDFPVGERSLLVSRAVRSHPAGT